MTIRTSFAFAFALAACVQPAPDAMLAAIEKHSATEDVVAKTLASVLPATLDANIRVLYPPSPNCAATRPHPFMVAGVNAEGIPMTIAHGPIVGQEFRVIFWTCSMPDANDDAAVWIAVGHEASAPVRLPVLSDCWALVAPDAQIPVGIAPGWQGSLRREPGASGRIELRWTPSAAAAGSKVYLQLLVFKPGVTATGFDVSTGVELTVGTQ